MTAYGAISGAADGVAVADKTINISWTANPATTATAASGYNVYMGTTAGGESATPVNGSVPITGTSVNVPNLTDGTTYYFTVKSVNALGSSSASSEVSDVPNGVTSAPQTVAVQGANTSATLTWSAPATNGGTPVIGYNVYYFTTASATTAAASLVTLNGTSASAAFLNQSTPNLGSAAVPANGKDWLTNGTFTTANLVSGTTYTVANLTNGTAYFFVVTAVNAVGESQGLLASATPTTPGTVPTAPTGVTATASSNSITIAWTSNSASNGYNVYQGTSAGGESTTPVNTLPITDSVSPSLRITGLTANTQYFFTVKALNSTGSSAASSEVTATTGAGVPGAPTIASVGAVYQAANVAVNAPASTGGSTISSYTVTATPSAGSSTAGVETCTYTVDSGVGYCQVGTLTNGVTYSFTAVATNSVGSSLASAAVTAVPAITAPDAPGAVSVAIANGVATLTWTYTGASTQNGSAQPAGYRILSSTASGNEVLVAQAASGATTATFAAPVGATYYFRVVAVTANGVSVPSNEVFATSGGTVAGAPTAAGVINYAVGAVADTSTAYVYWSAPLTMGTASVSAYKVYLVTNGNTGASALNVTTTGTASNISTALTIASAAGITAGMAVSGTGIDTGTTVASITGTSVTLSKATTAAINAGAIKFSAVALSDSTTAYSGNVVLLGMNDACTYNCTNLFNGGGYSDFGGYALVSGLTAGTKYTFIVTSVNGSGEDVVYPSSTVVVTALGTSNAPTNAAGAAGAAKATVSWTAPVNATDLSVASGYKVYTAAAAASLSDGTVTLTGLTISASVATVTVANCNGILAKMTITGTRITAGTTVTSCTGTALVMSANGASGGSSDLTFKLLGTANAAITTASTTLVLSASNTSIVPGMTITDTTTATKVPAGTYVISNTAGTLVLSQAVLSGASDVFLFTQQLQVCATSTAGVPCLANKIGALTSVVVNGLTAGSAVYFAVSATNDPLATVYSALSTASASVTPVAVPATPNSGSVSSPVLSGSVLVTHSSGAGATSWTATATPSGASCTALANTGACLIPGLTNGVSYAISVVDTNAVGSSASYVITASYTPLGKPGAMTGVTAAITAAQGTTTAPTYTVNVAWPIATLGGNPFGAYSVVLSDLTTGATTTYTLATPAQAAIAGGANGVGTQGAAASTTEKAAAIAYLIANGSGNYCVVPVAYLLSGIDTRDSANITSSANTCDIYGIAGSGDTAVFSVATTNTTGAGAGTTVSSATSPLVFSKTGTVTSKPGLAATGVVASSGSVTVTWTAPSFQGGVLGGILGYNVYVGTTSGGESSTPVNGSILIPAGTLTLTVPNLTNGKQYYFTVKAVNTAGSSVASTERSATPTEAPGAPVSVIATPAATSIALSWTAPSTTGGAPVTGYEVYAWVDSITPTTLNPVNATLVTGTSYTATGLATGTKYSFVVVALNAAGGSAQSSVISATPAAVAAVAVVALPKDVTVSFSASPAAKTAAQIKKMTAAQKAAYNKAVAAATKISAEGLIALNNYALNSVDGSKVTITANGSTAAIAQARANAIANYLVQSGAALHYNIVPAIGTGLNTAVMVTTAA